MHTEIADQGMKGSHTHDIVVLNNAHPHQQHSKGYGHPDGSIAGIDHTHLTHDRRDKAPEHHPPKGMVGY